MAPPPLGPKQILVKIRAAPINHSDYYVYLGHYSANRTLPTIPGFEGAGQILEVGSEVDWSLFHKNVAVWVDSVTSDGT